MTPEWRTAAQSAADSLRQRGFAVVRVSTAAATAMDDAMLAGGRVFDLALATKRSLLGAPKHHGSGCSEIGYVDVGGVKEVVHYRAGDEVNRFPWHLRSSATVAHLVPPLSSALHDAFAELGAVSRLLLQAMSLATGGHQYDLARLLDDAPLAAGAASTSVLSLFRYHAARSSAAAAGAGGAGASARSHGVAPTSTAAAGAAPHVDRGLLTLVRSGTAGLRVKDASSGEWVDVSTIGGCDADAVVVLCGDTLRAATGGVFTAVTHEVLSGPAARKSLAMRVRGREDAVLSSGKTVGAVMEAFAASHMSVNAPPGQSSRPQGGGGGGAAPSNPTGPPTGSHTGGPVSGGTGTDDAGDIVPGDDSDPSSGESDGDEPAQQLTLQFVGPDDDGDVRTFMVLSTTPLEQVFSAFAQAIGRSPATLRFLSLGTLLTSSYTPEVYALEDGDRIQVRNFMCGD